MTKLDKLAESDNSPHWKLKEEHRLLNGELIGKTYETHKRLISFRSNISTREMSEEQKETASEKFCNDIQDMLMTQIFKGEAKVKVGYILNNL